MIINFVDERLTSKEVIDHGIAIVLLPAPHQCDSAQAIEARALAKKITGSFPRSKVAANYDIAEKKWEQRFSS